MGLILVFIPITPNRRYARFGVRSINAIAKNYNIAFLLFVPLSDNNVKNILMFILIS